MGPDRDVRRPVNYEVPRSPGIHRTVPVRR